MQKSRHILIAAVYRIATGSTNHDYFLLSARCEKTLLPENYCFAYNLVSLADLLTVAPLIGCPDRTAFGVGVTRVALISSVIERVLLPKIRDLAAKQKSPFFDSLSRCLERGNS
jgi:hypothetical protein